MNVIKKKKCVSDIVYEQSKKSKANLSVCPIIKLIVQSLVYKVGFQPKNKMGLFLVLGEREMTTLNMNKY